MVLVVSFVPKIQIVAPCFVRWVKVIINDIIIICHRHIVTLTFIILVRKIVIFRYPIIRIILVD